MKYSAIGTRLKAAWAVLRGRTYLQPAPKVVYVSVRDGGRPDRWVQLVPYYDGVLALDAEGTLYQLHSDRGSFLCQLVMESPKRY